MTKCQKDVKCQKVKQLDEGGASQRKLDAMRFTHNDVNLDAINESHQKIEFMNILKIFDGHHM